MTLDQLKVLTTVAELGSLRAASEKLHKTQPALSQGISKLETQLGVLIFNREKYRLVLTEAGQQIYQHAKKVLFESEQLTQIAEHIAEGNETQVTIAFDASYNLSKLLPILEKTQARYPETQIVLTQQFLSGAYEQIYDGLADIALTAIMMETLNSKPLTAVKLYEGELITTAAPKLLARHSHLTQAYQLINEYQIVLKDSGTDTKGKLLGVLDGQRQWFTTDFSTKKMLILSGMGWGKLPDFMIETELKNGTLVRIELAGILSTVKPTYMLLKHNSKVLGPVGQSLWDEITESAQR